MSLFVIRSLIGASASRIRIAKSNIAFLEKCDLKDTNEYLHAKQELRLAEASATILAVEFQSALANADDVGRRELHAAAQETGFAIAA